MIVLPPTSLTSETFTYTFPFVFGGTNILTFTLPIRKPNVFVDEDLGTFEFDVIVLDESRRRELVLTNQQGVYDNDVATVVLDYEIDAGNYYFLILYQGSKELAKVKIFCTTQTDLQDYSITQGEFTEAPASSNDFIIID